MIWYSYAPNDARSDFRSVTTSWAGPPATGQRGDLSFCSWMDIKPINIGMKITDEIVNQCNQDKISYMRFSKSMSENVLSEMLGILSVPQFGWFMLIVCFRICQLYISRGPGTELFWLISSIMSKLILSERDYRIPLQKRTELKRCGLPTIDLQVIWSNVCFQFEGVYLIQTFLSAPQTAPTTNSQVGATMWRGAMVLQGFSPCRSQSSRLQFICWKTRLDASNIL